MILNKRDNAIISELDLNPKATESQLAKKLNTSQQVIGYHLKKLIKEKVIVNFGTLFNLSKIGYAEYRVLFKLSNVSEETKKNIVQYLKEYTAVSWAAIVGGTWDLFLIVFVRNYAEFDEFLDKLFNKFVGAFSDYVALYTLLHELYCHKYLHNKNGIIKPITINFANIDNSIKLDKTDKKICHFIKTFCRQSSVVIAKHCNISYKTVQNRVRKLEQQGFIKGYRPLLKSEILGYKAVMLLLSFQSYTHDVETKLFRHARNNLFITQAVKLFGMWHVLFHIRITDDKTLQNVIIEIRNLYPIIRDYEIIPVFEDITMDTFPMSQEK